MGRQIPLLISPKGHHHNTNTVCICFCLRVIFRGAEGSDQILCSILDPSFSPTPPLQPNCNQSLTRSAQDRLCKASSSFVAKVLDSTNCTNSFQMKFYLKSASVINSLLHQFAAEIPSLTDVDINKELFETTAARRKGTLSQTRGEGGCQWNIQRRSKFLQNRERCIFQLSHILCSKLKFLRLA